MKPVVALVGRPNVGKSTLFNRITRSKDALVDDFPGVTRDRHYGNAKFDDVEFILIDTGGFLDNDEDKFANEIRYQVHEAIDDADVVILVLDAKTGVSPFDADLVEILRSLQRPVFYLANKVDGESKEKEMYDFYGLGIDKLYPVSGEHGYGIVDFLDDLTSELSKMIQEVSIEDAPENNSDIINIAVVGRPNVGKSSLINKILGEKRLVVSDEAGTTRDSIDSYCEVNGKKYCLVDTAGIRRKGRVSKKLEKFSVVKALKSLDRCDVALILIDASEGITEQDITIAGYAHERKCGCIFLLNKWDLLEKDDKTVKEYYEHLRMQAKFLNFAPAMTISALTGQRVQRIFTLVDEVFEQYQSRVNTGKFNRIIEGAIERTEPSLHKGKRIKFYYSSQVATKPPTFVCFVNFPEGIHFSYKRYLINQIREHAGLDKTPVRLLFKLRTGKIEFGKMKSRRSVKNKKRKRK